jgi:hypothetical protein
LYPVQGTCHSERGIQQDVIEAFCELSLDTFTSFRMTNDVFSDTP